MFRYDIASYIIPEIEELMSSITMFGLGIQEKFVLGFSRLERGPKTKLNRFGDQCSVIIKQLTLIGIIRPPSPIGAHKCIVAHWGQHQIQKIPSFILIPGCSSKSD